MTRSRETAAGTPHTPRRPGHPPRLPWPAPLPPKPRGTRRHRPYSAAPADAGPAHTTRGTPRAPTRPATGTGDRRMPANGHRPCHATARHTVPADAGTVPGGHNLPPDEPFPAPADARTGTGHRPRPQGQGTATRPVPADATEITAPFPRRVPADAGTPPRTRENKQLSTCPRKRDAHQDAAHTAPPRTRPARRTAPVKTARPPFPRPPRKPHSPPTRPAQPPHQPCGP